MTTLLEALSTPIIVPNGNYGLFENIPNEKKTMVGRYNLMTIRDQMRSMNLFLDKFQSEQMKLSSALCGIVEMLRLCVKVPTKQNIDIYAETIILQHYKAPEILLARIKRYQKHCCLAAASGSEIENDDIDTDLPIFFQNVVVAVNIVLSVAIDERPHFETIDFIVKNLAEYSLLISQDEQVEDSDTETESDRDGQDS